MQWSQLTFSSHCSDTARTAVCPGLTSTCYLAVFQLGILPSWAGLNRKFLFQTKEESVYPLAPLLRLKCHQLIKSPAEVFCCSTSVLFFVFCFCIVLKTTNSVCFNYVFSWTQMLNIFRIFWLSFNFAFYFIIYLLILLCYCLLSFIVLAHYNSCNFCKNPSPPCFLKLNFLQQLNAYVSFCW